VKKEYKEFKEYEEYKEVVGAVASVFRLTIGQWPSLNSSYSLYSLNSFFP
jgi:hypothetical protein